MKKNQILITGLAAVIAAAVSVGGTMAYLTDDDVKTNTFTVGDVSISVQEDWDENESHNIVPNTQFSKNPFVHNDGSEPAWVAMKIEMPQELKTLVDNGKVTLENLAVSDKWEYDSENDIYYYKETIEKDADTEELFGKVIFSDTLTSEELETLGDETNIVVKGAAVQVDESLTDEQVKSMLAELLA